jgi:hypothetical protein
VKRDNVIAMEIKGRIHSEYVAANVPYYTENEKYLEMKYRLTASELHMEFYLDMFQDLYKQGDSFLGVYTGSKCLVAAKVIFIV